MRCGKSTKGPGYDNNAVDTSTPLFVAFHSIQRERGGRERSIQRDGKRGREGEKESEEEMGREGEGRRKRKRRVRREREGKRELELERGVRRHN